MFLLGASSPAKLETILASAIGQGPSYPEVGATSEALFPAGYRHVKHEGLIGSRADFERAVEGLTHWAGHEGAGIRIFPTNQSITVGATVLAVVSIGFATMVAPCRVVWSSAKPTNLVSPTAPCPVTRSEVKKPSPWNVEMREPSLACEHFPNRPTCSCDFRGRSATLRNKLRRGVTSPR